MKKEYMKPAMQVVMIREQISLLAGSGGSGIHTDDPQSPGGAISRELDEWLPGDDFAF